ncbi:rapid alkalinization factor-like [Zingiber officinale]|uniref:rapid alkalinization factor-like n=1 Tax=Zingiber officinale TaxID=94328 RepID=UPI001C4CA32D|nr:rapid alkalinization factor-like [Zingiber officinale]
MAKSLPSSSSTDNKTHFLLLPPLLLLFLLHQTTAKSSAVAELPCGRNADANSNADADGGGCLVEHDLDLELSSEESRRLLWAATEKKYISYEALKGDVVPCSEPGVPYYNCHVFPRASPYTRGCQIISGCRGDSP